MRSSRAPLARRKYTSNGFVWARPRPLRSSAVRVNNADGAAGARTVWGRDSLKTTIRSDRDEINRANLSHRLRAPWFFHLLDALSMKLVDRLAKTLNLNGRFPWLHLGTRAPVRAGPVRRANDVVLGLDRRK